MSVTWSLDKRNKLAELLDKDWLADTTLPVLTPRQISQPLGMIRHGAATSLLGICMSLRLQYCLTDSLVESRRIRWRRGKPVRPVRCWWVLAKVPISDDVIADIRYLRSILTDPHYQQIWTRPIAFLVKRDVACEPYSDASYDGLGGFAISANMMWRVSSTDLSHHGFQVFSSEASVSNAVPGLHINVLELIALIINLWLAIRCYSGKADLIISAFADNTSALSWLNNPAKVRNPLVRRLVRFLQTLLAFAPVPMSLQASHIAGILNIDADLLSRPKLAPSWESAISLLSPAVGSCLIYQVPYKLLISVRKMLTDKETGA